LKNNDLSGKRLLLLGGVRPACEIVKEAKKMHIVTAVTDYLPDSPAKKLADESYMANAMVVDEVCDLCREKKIDGIITGYVDSLLPYYEKICCKANLPCWGNANNLNLCLDKEAFKLSCEEAGVPVVPWVRVTKGDYLKHVNDLSFPVVIKPVDNSGSRGVFKCYDKEHLHELIEKASGFSKSGVLLIEKAMNPNNEFSAYYIINNGKVYLTGMGDRYVNDTIKDIAPIGKGMLFPSVKLDRWIKEIDPYIRKFFAQNEMNNGFVFIQGFFEEDRYYIHEMGYRLNGGFSYKIIEHFSKYNQIQQLIRFSLTGSMDESEVKKSDPYFNGYGMIVTVSLKPGIISEISGIEEISQHPGVLEFCQLHDKGEKLLSVGTTAQVFAYVLCAAENKEDLLETVEYIRENMKILDTSGKNMIYDIIEPSTIVFKE